MIIFRKIRWKNLLSFGNSFTEIELDKHRSTIVYGKNGNGKSVLEDGLCFVLYGKPFRKINKPLLVNSINKKHLVVEIEFETNNKKIVVKRGMNPDFFEIWIDGEMKKQEASVADYQKFLETQILRMNYKTFTQIVVLGSADYVQFMKLPIGNRREVIEDILDIKIFSVMDSILGKKVTENKEAVIKNNYELSAIKQKIEIEKEHLNKAKQNNEELIKEKQQKIEGYETQKLAFQKEIDDLLNQRQEIKFDLNQKKKLMNKLSSLETVRGKMEEKQSKVQKDIEFYEHNDNCPTCTQNIDQQFKENVLKEKGDQHKKMVEGMVEWKIKYNQTKNELDELLKFEKQVESFDDWINDRRSEIRFRDKFIQSIQEEIDQLKQPNTVLTDDTNLKLYQQELIQLSSVAEELSSNKRLMDVAGSILRDGGIKSRIIKQYIPIINQLVNQYLSSLDFYVNFEFDEQFNEKIKSRFRDEFSYASFSNGQKVRLDLSMLLTWRAVAEMRNSTACNLLILDEIFDNSLDNDGTEDFIKLLKAMNNKVNAFVISPKGDPLVDKFSNSIKAEFKNNFSQLICRES